MKNFKKLSILFLIVFILSSSISVFAMTRPASLDNYDGSPLRRTALSQVGNIGGEKYWQWCGFEEKVPWCACFVSWCITKACQNPYSQYVINFSTCNQLIDWFKSLNCWYGTDIEPLPGMVVFFDWEGDGISDHTGIVDKVDDHRISVIEGNSGNQCAINNYEIDSPFIFGYGAAFQDIIDQ